MPRRLMVLWALTLLVSLPIVIFVRSFGGGWPKFTFLTDYSDPVMVFAWATGAILIFGIPLATVLATVFYLVRRGASRGSAD